MWHFSLNCCAHQLHPIGQPQMKSPSKNHRVFFFIPLDWEQQGSMSNANSVMKKWSNSNLSCTTKSEIKEWLKSNKFEVDCFLCFPPHIPKAHQTESRNLAETSLRIPSSTVCPPILLMVTVPPRSLIFRVRGSSCKRRLSAQSQAERLEMVCCSEF